MQTVKYKTSEQPVYIAISIQQAIETRWIQAQCTTNQAAESNNLRLPFGEKQENQHHKA